VTGYAGTPPGFEHCDDVGHSFELRSRVPGQIVPKTVEDAKAQIDINGFSVHCVATIHAEVNAIIQAATEGKSIAGGTLYVTMTPCVNCAMVIIRAGIKRVVAKCKYPHPATEISLKMFKQAGIPVHHINDIDAQYK
jgi:dCMP deaminase